MNGRRLQMSRASGVRSPVIGRPVRPGPLDAANAVLDPGVHGSALASMNAAFPVDVLLEGSRRGFAGSVTDGD